MRHHIESSTRFRGETLEQTIQACLDAIDLQDSGLLAAGAAAAADLGAASADSLAREIDAAFARTFPVE